MLIAGVSGSTLTVGTIGVVLVAAFLHAAWNSLLHGRTDRLATLALLGVGAAAGSGVLLLFVRMPAGPSWPFLAASICVHLGYQVFLIEAYQIGDFSQMYPLARGTSPWLVAVVAAVVVGDSLAPVQVAGVLVVSAGLLGLVFAGGKPSRAQLPALGVALATGVTIAAYTVLDGVGVRRSGSPFGYTGWLILIQSIPFPCIYLALRRGPGVRELMKRASLRPVWAGLISLAAYGLILWAQTRAPLAAVAALREVSVVFGALIGAVLFKESFGRWRMAASVFVVAGVVLISLS
jgi:drug/metabolite transporter (DMT)-like permease